MSNKYTYYKQEELDEMMTFYYSMNDYITKKEKEAAMDTKKSKPATPDQSISDFTENNPHMHVGNGIIDQIERESSKSGTYNYYTYGLTGGGATVSNTKEPTAEPFDNLRFERPSNRNSEKFEFPVDRMVMCMDGDIFYELQKVSSSYYVFLKEDSDDVEVEEWEKVTDIKKIYDKDYVEIRGNAIIMGDSFFRLKRIEVG